MFDFVFGTLKRGLDKIVGNPQLVYTVVVAVLIIGAFVFMAERFVGIANDAQERLVNVRLGSLQDAFVSFAGASIDDPAYLNERIREISSLNETVSSFRVIRREEVSVASSTPYLAYVIRASKDAGEVGKEDARAEFLYTIAASDPSRSVTTEVRAAGTRSFETARAILGPGGMVIGVVITTQALSEADRAIEASIAGSLWLLAGVLVGIMLLFLRYSKVIDYMALYQKLKEVDQLKDDFISMASHELRSPLTVIRGYAEYIREAPELAPKTKEYAQSIDTSAQGLDALVGDILDVSKIEQGRMTFSLETLNPGVLAKEVVSSFALPAKEKGLTISFDETGAGDGQNISVDQARLKQVLVNIIGNAVKYTPTGSVTVRQYMEKDRVCIRVSDTGLGMSTEERAKLFEKFYRVKTDQTKDIRGTGLGLWITERIVREMKGTISVESIKGVGSHFIISFPKAA